MRVPDICEGVLPEGVPESNDVVTLTPANGLFDAAAAAAG